MYMRQQISFVYINLIISFLPVIIIIKYQVCKSSIEFRWTEILLKEINTNGTFLKMNLIISGLFVKVFTQR